MNKVPAVSIAALLLLAAVIAAVILPVPHTSESFSSPETVTVWLEDKGEIVTVGYRDYITGCLFGLMSPKCETEALKAAACALNSMAHYVMSHSSGFIYNGADFSDKTYCLPFISAEEAEAMYGDSYSKYLTKLNATADCGINSMITYDGEPIYAAMCDISSGLTDSAADILGEDIPYLQPVSAECDKKSEDYESFRNYTPEGLYAELKGLAPSASLTADYSSWFTDAEYYDSGTLRSISYGGCTVNGVQLKETLDLRSAAVSIDYYEDKFCFTCLGFGNNLGMSLYCANSLALQGQKAEDILLYFYPETELVSN